MGVVQVVGGKKRECCGCVVGMLSGCAVLVHAWVEAAWHVCVPVQCVAVHNISAVTQATSQGAEGVCVCV